MHGSIEITNKCNFRCKHCYCMDAKKKDMNISIDKFCKIVNMLKSTDALVVYLTGGEPFVLKNIEKYYMELVNAGFLVGLMTNASLINDKHIEMLKEYPPHEIEISLYGMSDVTYKKVCGTENCVIHILNVIKKLNSLGIKIRVKYVLMKQNMCDLEEFLKFAEQKNIKYEVKPAMLPISDPKDVNKYRVSARLLKDIENEKPELFRIPKKEDRIKCDAGNFFYITSNYKIKGCPIMQQEYDLDLEQQECEKYFAKVVENIKDAIYKIDNFYCPAWEQIEGRENISNYFSGKNEEDTI